MSSNVGVKRLRKRAEFLAVRNGEKRRGPLFLLEVCSRPQQCPQGMKAVSAQMETVDARKMHQNRDEAARVGFTVTKKNGNAVKRNRIRRRLREAVRVGGAQKMQKNTDYVIVARAECLTVSFDRLLGELERRINKPSGDK